MNTDTGKIRWLVEDEKPKPKEVIVNPPKPHCPRCDGGGSIHRSATTRAERRRMEKKGVPVLSSFYPCPECGGY